MYVYNVKLGFDPRTLTYDNELHEVFAQPRLAIIWNFRKSKHITDQHFNNSCKFIYKQLMNELPTSFVEFYDIVHKYTGNSETSLMDEKDTNIYRFSRVEKYNHQNYTKYWEPFFKCWLNPHLLGITLQNGETYELSMTMQQEKDNFDRNQEIYESDRKYDEHQEYLLNKKIMRQLTDKDLKYYTCKTTNTIINIDPCKCCKVVVCPVCKSIECVEKVAVEKILEILKIEIKMTDRDW